MRMNLVAGFVLVAASLVMPAVRVSGIDLHWLWQDRCAACHGHSVEFFINVLTRVAHEVFRP